MLLLLLCFEYCDAQQTNNDSLVEFMQGDLCGFKNLKGAIIIPAQFENGFGEYQFHNGQVIVRKDMKTHYSEGVIDRTGKIIIPFKFLKIEYKEGLYYANNRSVKISYGVFVNLTLQEVNLEKGYNFKGLGYVIFNRQGQLTMPYAIDDGDEESQGSSWKLYVGKFNYNLASVRINGKYGCINRKGQLVIPAIYDSPLIFFNGEAQIWQGEKMGAVDTTGKVISELK